jgi:hypothetical protein
VERNFAEEIAGEEDGKYVKFLTIFQNKIDVFDKRRENLQITSRDYDNID